MSKTEAEKMRDYRARRAAGTRMKRPNRKRNPVTGEEAKALIANLQAEPEIEEAAARFGDNPPHVLRSYHVSIPNLVRIAQSVKDGRYSTDTDALNAAIEIALKIQNENREA